MIFWLFILRSIIGFSFNLGAFLSVKFHLLQGICVRRVQYKEAKAFAAKQVLFQQNEETRLHTFILESLIALIAHWSEKLELSWNWT